MGTAAEFNGEVSNPNNSNDTAVLFTEQCHCTQFLSFFNGHFLCGNRNGIKNLLVDQRFYLVQFFRSQGREMREVKTALLAANQLTSLVNMVTLPQSCLQQVRCSMIPHGVFPLCLADFSCYHIADLNGTSFYSTNVQEVSILCLGGGGNRNGCAFIGEGSAVSNLTAAFCIERCPIQYDNNLIAFCGTFYCFFFPEQCHNLCLRLCKGGITSKGRFFCLNFDAVICPRGTNLCHMVCSCLLTLFFYELIECLPVNGNTVFCCNFFCQVNREAICITEFKSICAG